jgi:hypothetical protein
MSEQGDTRPKTDGAAAELVTLAQQPMGNNT